MSSRAPKPEIDQAAIYRAQVGAFVRHRLMNTPGVFKIPSQGLDVFVLRDFLTPAECARLCEMIDADRAPSGLLSASPDPDFRTSESCNLDPWDQLNIVIQQRIDALLGIEHSHGETIQGQRYAVGQQFKPHHDFFYADQPYWEDMQRSGGQRTWTAMIFLNEPESGGETAFPKAAIKVAPRTGNLLAWNNMNAIGEPNEFSLHQGLPVTAGLKYIITKWHRERLWGYSNAPTY